jgi:2,3-dihydroxybenzoate-AMP ligase
VSALTADDRMPDHRPDLAAAYRAAGLWGTGTIPTELTRTARRHPAADAVVAEQGRLDYRALDEWTDRVAAGLLDLGLVAGERVLMQVTNRLESVVAWYACLKAGLVPVATLASHRAHEIDEIGRQAQAAAHLVERDLAGFDLVTFARDGREARPTVREVLTIGGDLHTPAPGTTVLETLGAHLTAGAAAARVATVQAGVGPDDLAALQLSGGTTGVPKLIPRRHAEYWYNARAYAERLGLGPTSRVAHLIPVIHNAGITCAVHAAHSVGACLVLGTPDALRSAELLGRERADTALIGHGHFQALADPAFLAGVGSLRRVLLSGTKVPDRLFEVLEDRGIWAGQLFGMAEGLFCLSRPTDPREARLRSVGTALSAWDEIRILVPGTEEPVEEGQVGELCCRGPYTIPGYYAAPEQNRSSFTTDGFYRTGDLARWQRFEGEPHLLIEGRIKDVINRGGEKINAEEVELLLLRHPEVQQAAVVAMPDERLGERSCAYLVASSPLGLSDVQAHFAGLGVAKFKWPERVELVPDLPRTKVGKIDKSALRDAVATLAGGGGGPPASLG